MNKAPFLHHRTCLDFQKAVEEQGSVSNHNLSQIQQAGSVLQEKADDLKQTFQQMIKVCEMTVITTFTQNI